MGPLSCTGTLDSMNENTTAVAGEFDCAKNNSVLSALPRGLFQEIIDRSELIDVPARFVFYEPDQELKDIYFLCGGLASALTVMQDGRTTEAITLGNEGFVGFTPLIDGFESYLRCTMLVEGRAIRVPAILVKDLMERHLSVAHAFRNYSSARVYQLSQLAACNSLHSIEQRFARWLLLSADLLNSSTLPVTHEVVAEVLGAQRTTITAVAGKLEAAGAIKPRRGQVSIDRTKLQTIVCECYLPMLRSFQYLRKLTSN